MTRRGFWRSGRVGQNAAAWSAAAALQAVAWCVLGCGSNGSSASAVSDAGVQDTGKTPGHAYLDPNAPIEDRVTDLLSQMTLEEKIAQMHGGGTSDAGLNPMPDDTRLHIPGFQMVDGMRGVSITTGNATTFPVGSARGATFDPALEQQVGQAIGEEARAKGANVLLAPTINNLRHPRWGRAQETYGEDTFHIGSMAAAFVQGVQQEVIANPKHFAAYSIEDDRFSVDVHVDERSLREIYLPHFKAVIEAGAGSIMSAYNQVNGLHCDQNAHLLSDILDGEWKFDGFVESDWTFGTTSTAPSALAGLDIEMPAAKYFGKPLFDAVDAGTVPLSTIDEAVRRVLRAKFRFGIFDGKPALDPATVVQSAAHTTLARTVEEEAIVLLKNDASALPLDRTMVHTIAVVGALANTANIGDTGSSLTQSSYVITPLAGFQAHAAPVQVVDLSHDTLSADDEAKLGTVDAAVVVVGLTSADEGEGQIAAGDRKQLPLSAAQEQLVLDVASHNPRTVVLLEGSGAIVMENWVDKVQGVMEVWYPGLEGGNAIANVVFGDVDPSGKLPVTFPESESQLPPFVDDQSDVTYGYLHGYRYVDSMSEQPRFPFGFGLSYTTFTLSNFALSATSISVTGSLMASVNVTNSGTRAGDDVVELYVGYPSSTVQRSPHDLKGFTRVHLQAGQTTTVTLPLAAQDVAYYDTNAKAWKVEPITYSVLVGSSSRDLALSAQFAVH
jgi:beta-glucosidase